MFEKAVHFLRRYAVVIGALLLFALFFAKLFFSILLIAAVIVVALVVNGVGLRQYGLEVATLSTVVVGVAYGPVAGAILGFIFIILQLIIGQYISTYALWVVPGYVLLGIIAGVMGEVTLALPIGLIIFFILCTTLFTPGNLARYLPYALGNIVVNVVLFRLLGEGLAGLLSS